MKYKGKDLMEYFPLESARGSQKAVLLEIDKAFDAGQKFIILEAPVGSGKSAIAMTLANAFDSAHIITPRKSLQNQYFDDFSEDVVLMKGRSSYPCTYQSDPHKYKAIIKHIENGMIQSPDWDEPNCSSAPCKNSNTVFRVCTEETGICPYSRAMEVAEDHPTVIHNLHSFIYQTNFSQRFTTRDIMIVDEAHEIESVIRGFITKKINVPKKFDETKVPVSSKSLNDWCNFLSSAECAPSISAMEARNKRQDPEYVTDLDKYNNAVEDLRLSAGYYGDSFTVTFNKKAGSSHDTEFNFIPHKLGNAASRLIFDFGKRVLLMSGTIYDKAMFCRNLGLNPDDAYFIRIPSTFPIPNRPIYIKEDYQADTSFVGWNDNFKDIIEKIEKIAGIFHDVKGLIHAPSYEAAEQLYNAIPGNRIVTHTKTNFQEKLSEFYLSKDNKIFISPVCQQGVDFKEDRARFQIILRVPYLNTSDDFVRDKVENDFNWYNYQALIVFGQQLGRPVRSESDYGATFLMDERFNRFISRNSGKIPKWVQQAIIWR